MSDYGNIFLCSRASLWAADKVPPCEEAFEIELEYQCYGGRKQINKEWAIKIDTLDQLIAFIEKYGGVVIDNGNYDKLMHITIYDDWIE